MTHLFTLPDGEEAVLGTVGEVAEILGEAKSTVSMWAARRATTGFPEPVATFAARNGLPAAHYDIDAVRVWRIFWIPDRGRARRKLTTANEDEIRTRYAAGGVTYRALASEHGVTHTVIGRVMRGERQAG